jgi:hypothetical protein
LNRWGNYICGPCRAGDHLGSRHVGLCSCSCDGHHDSKGNLIRGPHASWGGLVTDLNPPDRLAEITERRSNGFLTRDADVAWMMAALREALGELVETRALAAHAAQFFDTNEAMGEELTRLRSIIEQTCTDYEAGAGFSPGRLRDLAAEVARD